MESKYRWREVKKKCPKCGKEAIIKGKAEYGGGWLCFAKKGGCGAKWPDGTPEIEEQASGLVPNDDIYSLVNTILKMAEKRALVDAALHAGRLSNVFTQDIEDLVENGAINTPTSTPEKQQPPKPVPVSVPPEPIPEITPESVYANIRKLIAAGTWHAEDMKKAFEGLGALGEKPSDKLKSLSLENLLVVSQRVNKALLVDKAKELGAVEDEQEISF